MTLTVDVDPASNTGLRLTPSAGTVAVADLNGGQVAADLGIRSTAAATIKGDNLDPRLTTQTLLSDLNGGTGIGSLTGTGLQISLGQDVKTIDLSSAVTLEDVFNQIQQSGLNVSVGINAQGTALDFASKVSGADLSVGENNGSNATLLGIRTFTADTPLADLNGGSGVSPDPQTPLTITRRDGTSVDVDLSAAKSVQDVLDAVNAVDPGVLVASLNTKGNGINLVDNDGTSTGPLAVADNSVSEALGLNGAETGSDPSVPLIGKDVNPQQDQGVFGVLARLEKALRSGDDQELTKLDASLGKAIDHFSLVRGEVGSRLKLLDQVDNRLSDQDVSDKQSLSDNLDADLTDVVTQVTQVQTSLEATLKIAVQANQLSILSFL